MSPVQGDGERLREHIAAQEGPGSFWETLAPLFEEGRNGFSAGLAVLPLPSPSGPPAWA